MVVGLSEKVTILAACPLVTVTTTGAVTVRASAPVPAVAERVYVVVTAGDTTRLPLSGRFVPTPLISTRSAPVVVQDRVEDSPVMMLVGVASKRRICGFAAGAAPTVTVTVACCVLPPEPVATSVYVVVAAGETVAEPCTRRLLPTPGVIFTEVAPVTFHSSMDCCPGR